jgi:hypothetical protein
VFDKDLAKGKSTNLNKARLGPSESESVIRAAGGSDFHGTNRPHIILGTGEGKLRVPQACWDDLFSRLLES